MRQPHQEAHELSSTFRPRQSLSRCTRPSRSGSAKSGAASERATPARSSPLRPHTHVRRAASWTTAWPRWRASAATSTAPSARTSSAQRGTQTGPRQRPSGFAAQPRPRSSASGATHSDSPSAVASSVALASSKRIVVSMGARIRLRVAAGQPTRLADGAALCYVSTMEIPQTTPREASTVLERNRDAVYLDVRTEAEFEAGHPAGARNIPLVFLDRATHQPRPNPEFVAAVERHVPRTAKLLVGCQSGGRSPRACELLAAAGYADVTNEIGRAH